MVTFYFKRTPFASTNLSYFPDRYSDYESRSTKLLNTDPILIHGSTTLAAVVREHGCAGWEDPGGGDGGAAALQLHAHPRAQPNQGIHLHTPPLDLVRRKMDRLSFRRLGPEQSLCNLLLMEMCCVFWGEIFHVIVLCYHCFRQAVTSRYIYLVIIKKCISWCVSRGLRCRPLFSGSGYCCESIKKFQICQICCWDKGQDCLLLGRSVIYSCF